VTGAPGAGAIPVTYQPIPASAMERRLVSADRPGAHLWVMVAAWIIADPRSAADPDVIKLMDRENLVQFQGPGCFKCEQPFSNRLARKPCRGKL
jgi:hypothetical protein